MYEVLLKQNDIFEEVDMWALYRSWVFEGMHKKG